MWTDLRRDKKNSNLIAGIYIGGGDTRKLLTEVYTVNFDTYLKEVIEKGIPVYGGSAGAVILGKDIRTAPEVQGMSSDESKGLNVLFGYSVYCHFELNKLERIRKLVEDLRQPIIALSERTGVYLQDKLLTVYGTEPVHIILEKKGEVILQPGEKYRLSK